MLTQIKNRKTYALDHELGAFKIYTTQHKTGAVYGVVLYYTRQGSWAEGTDIGLEFKIKQFSGFTQEEVYNQCIRWVNANMTGTYDVFLIEEKEF
jgi:hypothetical protein